MSIKPYFERMADYNRWMNHKLYRAAGALSDADLHADKGAFFASVFGTLNHILVADTIWLKRFVGHPSGFNALQSMAELSSPASLGQIIYSTLSDLSSNRRDMDETIIRLCAEASDGDYQQTLGYRNTSGQEFAEEFGSLVQHFFNHQTHHRGQVTTLLSQCGIDVGATDLVAMLRERSSE